MKRIVYRVLATTLAAGAVSLPTVSVGNPDIQAGTKEQEQAGIQEANTIGKSYAIVQVGRRGAPPVDINNKGVVLLRSGDICEVSPERGMNPITPGSVPVDRLIPSLPIATALNDRGDVLYSLPDGEYIRTSEGAMERILAIPGSQPFPHLPWQSLNNNHQALVMRCVPDLSRSGFQGNMQVKSYTVRNFLWQGGGVEEVTSRYRYSDAPVASASNRRTAVSVPRPCEPRDANDAGEIVGHITGRGKAEIAFFASKERVYPLSPLSGSYKSFAFGVNNRKEVVGYSLGKGEIATIWRDGHPVDLNELLPANSGWYLRRGWRINDRGEIIGDGAYRGKLAYFALIPPRAEQRPATGPDRPLVGASVP